MSYKLNTLLAKTDQLGGVFKNGLKDYIRFFKTNQGAFKGERKTYQAKDGTIDDPGKRGHKLVVTTVAEKLQWLEQNSEDYIDSLFSQEKTNSQSPKTVELKVGDISFGHFSTLELLRLKNLLENADLKDMYENLPVRTEDEIWNATTAEEYKNRVVFESTLLQGVSKTTTKESYILPDPNISKENSAKYTPQIAHKDTVVELGNYTQQRYTGEISHRERAGILQRRSQLLVAVIEALKEANDVEAVPSDMTARKLFSYLHNGSI